MATFQGAVVIWWESSFEAKNCLWDPTRPNDFSPSKGGLMDFQMSMLNAAFLEGLHGLHTWTEEVNKKTSTPYVSPAGIFTP